MKESAPPLIWEEGEDIFGCRLNQGRETTGEIAVSLSYGILPGWEASQVISRGMSGLDLDLSSYDVVCHLQMIQTKKRRLGYGRAALERMMAKSSGEGASLVVFLAVPLENGTEPWEILAFYQSLGASVLVPLPHGAVMTIDLPKIS